MNEEKTEAIEPGPTKCPVCGATVEADEPRITTKSGGVAHFDCALVTVSEATKLQLPGLKGKLQRERLRKTEKVLARAQKKHAREAKKRARE